MGTITVINFYYTSSLITIFPLTILIGPTRPKTCSSKHTRLDCKQKNDTYYKIFKSEWAKTYNSVHIVDDSPNVWLNTENYDKQITFIVPKEFRGEVMIWNY